MKFPFSFFGIIDFEKQHLGHLLDALRIAVDAAIPAHDVLQFFNKIIQAHRNPLLCCNSVDQRFHAVYGIYVLFFSAK